LRALFDFGLENSYFDQVSMYVRLHIVVQGLVQGVGFRYFVYHHAKKLQLAGWVRNLFNGDVEIEVEGERSFLESLLGEVKIGPRSAHVKDLHIEWQPYENKYSKFEIR
jgi:acylphosphatase